jgi:hypothetical protein
MQQYAVYGHFYVNTVYRLRELANRPAWTHRFEGNYLVMKVGISANGVFDWDINVLEQVSGKTYRRHHEIIKERSFSHEKVRRALRLCFEHVRAYDFAGWSRPKATSGRLFYVCQ